MLFFIEQLKSRNGSIKNIYRCRCDVCGSPCDKVPKLGKKRYHFCGRDCSNKAQRSGGLLSEQVKQTNIERLGVEYPLQSKDVQRRSEETIAKIYNKSRTELMRDAFKHKNGVDNPSQLAGVVEKRRLTSLSKRGVECPWQDQVVKDKAKQTCLIRYGVEHYAQSDEFKARASRTNVVNLGVEWPMQSQLIKSKIDYVAAAVKRHQTMKLNGTYRKSKAEDAFYQILLSAFSFDDVERCHIANGWEIDFYIRSLDAFIQFDGVYWHGLDRTFEQLSCSMYPRDKVIMGTVERDRRQEEWFKQNNKNLLRFTDKQLKNGDVSFIEIIAKTNKNKEQTTWQSTSIKSSKR